MLYVAVAQRRLGGWKTEENTELLAEEEGSDLVSV